MAYAVSYIPVCLQAWLPAPSQLGRSGAAVHAKDSQGVQQPPTSASRDPTSGSFHAQPAPDAAALAKPEMHMPESSGSMGASTAPQGQPTRPALLSEASLGLSLSDAGNSASVLSSLDAASDMDADVDVDLQSEAHAAGLAAPAASSPGPLWSPGTSSPSEIQPHRTRVPSSPFQDEPDADRTLTRPMPGMSTQALSSPKAGTSMQADQGTDTEPTRKHMQPVLSSSVGLSWQEQDEQPLQAAQGRESVSSIQGASSDLMEAWNEQENLAGSQSRRPSQMQERLSLGESDLMLDELEELEQASSMLEGLVGTAELAQQPQHSSSAAPKRPEPLPTPQAAGQQPGVQAAAFVKAAAASGRQPARQAAEGTAELSESAASAEVPLASQHGEQQGSAAARQLSSAPSKDGSTAGLGSPISSGLSESAQPAPMLAADQAGSARPGSTQTPIKAILRPADDAFREAPISPIAEGRTVVEDVAPADHSSPGRMHSESDQSQQTRLSSAFTAASGVHSSDQQQQQQQQQGLEQHSMGAVATPRMRDAVGVAVPHSSVVQAATAAGPQDETDLLARAEALERALATGTDAMNPSSCESSYAPMQMRLVMQALPDICQGASCTGARVPR